MTELHCYAAGGGDLLWRRSDDDAVHDRLADINVRYARIELPPARLDALASPDEVIEAFRQPLDGLMQNDNFNGLDVTSVQPGQADQAQQHRHLMAAHAHAGTEAHLFIEGQGAFFMQAGQRVYALHCAPGDFIRLPGGLRHWFDMGRQPGFRCIHLYSDPEALALVGDRVDMRGMFSSPQAPAG